MSDYLWDKTGEPDEDVRRLEGLLGEFRHRPRALELPASAEGFARVGRRAPRAFRPAWLALAAAVLLLFVLAGALFVARRGAGLAGGEGQTAARATPAAPRQHGPPGVSLPPATESANRETTPTANDVAKHEERGGEDARGGQAGSAGPTFKDERAGRQVIPRETERRPSAGEVALKQRGGASSLEHGREAAAEGATPRVVNASAARAEAQPEKHLPLEVRRQQAKDDLMYALRLAGIKLKDVQRKTQKADDWKSSFDEQKRLR